MLEWHVISLLIHGFLPVNARLLIAFGTAFYAIIYIKTAQSHKHAIFAQSDDSFRFVYGESKETNQTVVWQNIFILSAFTEKPYRKSLERNVI